MQPHDQVQPMIVGQTAQISGEVPPFSGQPVVSVGPPSQAAKVIGILVIIYGVLSILMVILALVGIEVLNEWAGENVMDSYGVPSWIHYANMAAGLIIAGGTIYAGYLITQFQTKGVYIAWGLLGASLLIQTLLTAITPEAAGGGIVGAGMGLVCGGACTLICGALAAIPMMVSNNGLQ